MFTDLRHRLVPSLAAGLLCLGLFAPLAAEATDPPDRDPSAHAKPALVAPQGTPPADSLALDLQSARVRHLDDLDLLVFEIEVAGRAGASVPTARGRLDGAPVLGYVFPTNLEPAAVGFRAGDGIVALAVTSHPDFDDTPLWDENGNTRYDDDGVVYHTHWVVLVPDARVAGGLAVAEIAESAIAEVLPPTHPGMPMLMDSPGFSVVLRGATLRVLVPVARAGGADFPFAGFRFDAVTAYMEVGPGPERPMLGVYQVYDVLSGDLSLPFALSR
ncbi:MAG: hypothetical protein AAGC60_15545 [Acidobacteriota bacterium]